MGTQDDTANKIRLGDQEVFKELYSLYYENLCKFIYSRFLKDIEETEEIVQGVFVKLWEKHSELPEINSIRAYLYKAACNAAINFITHQQVKQKHKNNAYIQLKAIEAEDDFLDDNNKTTIEQLKDYMALKFHQAYRRSPAIRQAHLS